MILERIQKLVSQAGVASRREAEKLISKGKVFVNGKRASLGDKATFKDNITVDGIPIEKELKVYYLINKPRKTICTLKDPFDRLQVTDLIQDDRKLFSVGRLDYNTTGTLIITNDGELSNKLCHPSHKILRLYRARIDNPLSNKELAFLNSDKIMIDGKPSFQEVTQVDNKSYVISLHVGTYHHVKKIFELVDKLVLNLTRIEFAGLTHVGNLNEGQYRLLKPFEIVKLKRLVNISK